MSTSSIKEEVTAFVADFTRHNAAKITPNTTLFGDIGIDGDDGDEFLTAFRDRFQVDMSACRPVHFGGEGFFPWTPFSWLHQALIARTDKSSTPESRAGLVPIMIQDLIEAAYSRRWMLKYKEEPNQPLQRNASTGSVSSFESPARRG